MKKIVLFSLIILSVGMIKSSFCIENDSQETEKSKSAYEKASNQSSDGSVLICVNPEDLKEALGHTRAFMYETQKESGMEEDYKGFISSINPEENKAIMKHLTIAQENLKKALELRMAKVARQAKNSGK